MARAADQRMALMTAAGMIDTSDLTTQAQVDAAEAAIAGLEAALAAAVDVSDADKAVFQGQVDAAETAVATAQSALDHAAQTMALMDAVTALQAIDLTDLSTQEKIDAANTAIEAVRAALAAATELSASEKTEAMTELGTADRTVMIAQGNFDTEAQRTALADAVATLAALDLDNLMTQEQIDAAVAAITGVDLALEAATNLTTAEKLDATVDVTVAKRKVDRAETALADNIDTQRTALTTAGTALAAIDLDDLDTQEKIDAADAAVEALKAALDEATHLSDSEKADYQTQLDEATEDVRMAQTGMDRDGRMMTQRNAITSAVTMARTAVGNVDNESTDSEVASADAAIAALKKAIEDAVDLPEDDANRAMAMGTLDTLEPQLAAAKTARTAYMATKGEQDKKANAELGEAMHDALAGPAPATENALDNIDTDTTPVSLSGAGLVIDAATGAGSLPDSADHASRTLEKGDSAGSLGSWEGTNYALPTGTGDQRFTNEARVYINQGAPEREPFGEVHTLTDGSLEVAAGNVGLVMADAFTHALTQTHAVPDRADAVYVRGTYDGAPGEYSCSTGCSSTNDGEGSPSALGGTWTFTPDTGAMVSRPDATYLYYGWWVRKDHEDMPTAASAFTGVVLPDGGTAPVSVDVSAATMGGSATYNGHAAGKFAISNPLDGTGSGGHFTADATLTAKFGPTAAPNNGGVSGTLDNFMANDESEPWSVELHLAPWGATGAFTSTSVDTDDIANGTTWSIDGNSAPESGTWSGQMYDELPGATDATPPGDGSNIPTTATGTFYSEFSSIGRMVGGFGVDKQ